MSLLGFPIKDSHRPADEVTEQKVPDNSRIINISFELIPPSLITGIITEKGLISPQAVSLLMEPEKMNDTMVKKLERWKEESEKLN